MQISENGVKLIKSFEGCRLKAYKAVATEEYWTIGWGHYGADVKEGMTITQKEADELFLKDIQRYVNYVNNPSYVGKLAFNQNEFDALVSFCYNCGNGNLKKLCYGKTKKEIAENILLYNKSGGNVLAGLVRRRQTERDLFVTPIEEKPMQNDEIMMLLGDLHIRLLSAESKIVEVPAPTWLLKEYPNLFEPDETGEPLIIQKTGSYDFWRGVAVMLRLEKRLKKSQQNYFS